jgi:glycosyltransferase involved in cell wall biosynthesis
VAPKISVCLTTYNRADLLDVSLRSLAQQSRLPDELIVSDDCSPDRTPDVVARWQRELPQLRYERNVQNLYMPGNLNAAVSKARGEYIANLHDGDEFHPKLLEEWEAALDRHPTAGFVFCGVHFKGRPPELKPETVLHEVAPLTKGREFYERHMRHRFSSIVWGTVMARKAAYDVLLPFDAAFGFISDVDMWMRMCLRFDVAYVRKPLLILDDSPTGERNFSWSRTETIRRMEEVNLRRFYGDDPPRLDRELRRHTRVARRFYASRVLGQLRHLKLGGAVEGLRHLLRVSATPPTPRVP